MPVFNRVYCPACKRGRNIYDEKLKSFECSCGGQVAIKKNNFFIDYPLPNGKRRREKVGPSRKLAEDVLSKRRVQIVEGKIFDVVKAEKIKFADFAQEYLNVHSKQHKKSWETDFHLIKTLNKYFGGKNLYEITPQDIEHYKMDRIKTIVAGRAISNATVNRQMDVLRGIFNKAISWGKLQSSPMKAVGRLKVPPGRLRFLEKEEIVKLISNCTNNLKPIVVLALYRHAPW